MYREARQTTHTSPRPPAVRSTAGGLPCAGNQPCICRELSSATYPDPNASVLWHRHRPRQLSLVEEDVVAKQGVQSHHVFGAFCFHLSRTYGCCNTPLPETLLCQQEGRGRPYGTAKYERINGRLYKFVHEVQYMLGGILYRSIFMSC